MTKLLPSYQKSDSLLYACFDKRVSNGLRVRLESKDSRYDLDMHPSFAPSSYIAKTVLDNLPYELLLESGVYKEKSKRGGAFTLDSYEYDIKAQNKLLADLYGPKVGKRVRGLNFNAAMGYFAPEVQKYLWCDPKKVWGKKPVLFYKPNLQKVYKVFRHKELFDQLLADNLIYLAPVTGFLGFTPQKAKSRFGKGLWKQICSWSPYRIKVFGEYLENFWPLTSVCPSLPTQELECLVNIPASRMKAMTQVASYYGTSESRIWTLRNMKNSNRNVARALYDLSLDTQTQLDQLGRKVNTSWSPKRMKEEHDKASKEILAQQFSSEPFCEPFTTTVDEYTFNLLTSPLDIAQEGQTMRHCVGSYAQRAKEGLYKVFTVEGKGERATLGVAVGVGLGETLKFNQCYGAYNKRVSEGLNTAAHKLIFQLNQERESK